MKHSKLRAFTMIELLVAMVISALVIGFCYLAYSMAQRNYTEFRSASGRINESAKLQNLLFFDVGNCERIMGADRELLFLFEKNKSVTYLFQERSVVRIDGAARDTLSAEVKEIACRYTQKEMSGNERQIIDEISFILSLQGEEETFRYYKSYPADVLLQQDSGAVEF